MSMWKISGLFLLAAAAFAADISRLEGPVSGFVFDREQRAVRPVVGVLGAAYLGDALAEGLDFASVSPDGKVAVAIKDGRLYAARGLDRGEVSLAAIDSAISSIDRAAWSGSSAAIYSASGQRVEIWRGLGDTSEQVTAADLPDSCRVVALAAGNGAAAVASEDGAVYVIRDGSSRLAARVTRPGGIAISGNDLFVTDRDRNEVLRIANYTEASDAVLFANEARGVTDPVAVAVARGRVFVASGSGRNIIIYDAASGAQTGRLDVDFEPSRVDALYGSLFVLNAGGSEPLQVLDAGESPAVYFVPARRAE